MSKKEQEYESLNINQTIYKTRLSKKFKEKEIFSLPDVSRVNCFIPGTIVEIVVKVGQEVEEGQDLLILEAMKMKNRIKSPAAGKVRRINVKVGDTVPKGQNLVVLI